jgi:hypothetical protein
VVALGQLDGRVELAGGGIERTAEQADPAQHGQGVRLPPRFPGRLGQGGRLLQEPGSTLVVGPVAGDAAQVGQGLGPHRGGVLGEREGVGEPQLGPVIPSAQEIHVAKLGPGLGHGLGKLVGQRDLVGLVQGRQSRFVKAAERVDQRLRQREPCADPQSGRAGAIGEPGGGPQRVDPGLDRAG